MAKAKRDSKADNLMVIFWVLASLWSGFALGRQFPTKTQRQLAYLDGWSQAFNYDYHWEYERGFMDIDPTPVPTPTYLDPSDISRAKEEQRSK